MRQYTAPVIFLLWALAFIFQSSFMINDTRMFSLFDDGMISMRYAYNLSHGSGAVWNPGEAVEGYTNPLMMLVMSAFTGVLPRHIAPLGIQVFGLVTMLVIGMVMWQLTHSRLLVASTLFYYPLAFWALMGMETGLVTLFALALVWKRHSRWWVTGGLACLLYLTRPDALVIAGVVLVYTWHEQRRIDWRVVGIIAFCIATHMILRLAYYGEIVPNTYTLKVSGVPLLMRLENGLRFASLFALSVSVLIGLALLKRPNRLYALLVIAVFAYQIYVGGDPWRYWRIFAPVVPLLMILALAGTQRAKPGWKLVFVAGILLANAAFLPQMLFLEKPYTASANASNVRRAYILNELLSQGDTIAVTWAGAIPYYTDFYAVDLLGKSDAYIARLAPDTESGISILPGHNKYDLAWSVATYRPAYMQTLTWARDDLRGLGLYQQVDVDGVMMWLRDDIAVSMAGR